MRVFTKEVLSQRKSFFSLVAYRGIFYGSVWSAKNAQIFDNPAAFVAYQIEIRQPAEHFQNFTAYGTANRHRTVTKLQGLYDGTSDWEVFCSNPNNLNGREVYRYLMQKDKFFGIGGLTALLICGDLECAKFITTEVEDIGDIVESVQRGAAKALQRNGLVLGNEKGDVSKAFVRLFHFLDDHLTAEEKILMKWNNWMCEFALCKSGRVH